MSFTEPTSKKKHRHLTFAKCHKHTSKLKQIEDLNFCLGGLGKHPPPQEHHNEEKVQLNRVISLCWCTNYFISILHKTSSLPQKSFVQKRCISILHRA